MLSVKIIQTDSLTPVGEDTCVSSPLLTCIESQRPTCHTRVESFAEIPDLRARTLLISLLTPFQGLAWAWSRPDSVDRVLCIRGQLPPLL